jgi:hypothetical protein
MVGGVTTEGCSRPGAHRRPHGCRDPALIACSVRSRTYRRFECIGWCACPWRSCLWRTCRRRGCSAASRSASMPGAQPAPLVAAVARDGLTQGPHLDCAGSWRRIRPARWSPDAAPSATPGTGRCRPRRLTARRRAGHPSVWCQAALVASLSLLCRSKDSSGMAFTLAAVRAGANRLSCPFRARGELTPTEGEAGCPGLMFGCNGFAQPSQAVWTRSFAAGATARACSPAVTTLPLDAQTRSRRRGLRASAARGMGSGGTHSGQWCPYPRSPRVGTLLGMCNDQVAPALAEPAVSEHDR